MIQAELPSTSELTSTESVEELDNATTPAETEQAIEEKKEQPSEPVKKVKQWTEPKTRKILTEGKITIEIPFCWDKKIRPRRRFMSALRELTEKQRFGLNVILEGMRIEGTELQHGSAVNNHTNTIRALLESAADAAKREIEKKK